MPIDKEKVAIREPVRGDMNLGGPAAHGEAVHAPLIAEDAAFDDCLAIHLDAPLARPVAVFQRDRVRLPVHLDPPGL